VDAAGVFHKILRIDDLRPAEIFAREVPADLVCKELLSPEWAERVGKYMIRPLLALERLTFLEPEGKVGYRWGRDGVSGVHCPSDFVYPRQGPGQGKGESNDLSL